MLKLLLLLSVIGEFKSAPDVGYSLTSEKDGSILYRASVKDVILTYNLKTLQAEPGEGVKRIEGIDFIGAVTGGWAVLFHNDARALRSTASFVVESGITLKFLVCGLAPGGWEIWRNGWLEDTMNGVDAHSGVLYFEGAGGSYFIRRSN